MKKGTYVLRSTYQKLFEENKKLKEDIRTLSEEGIPSAQKILTLNKWRKHFRHEKAFEVQLNKFFAQIAENIKKQKSKMSKQKIIELKDLFQAQWQEYLNTQKRCIELKDNSASHYYIGKKHALEYVINKLEEYLESN